MADKIRAYSYDNSNNDYGSLRTVINSDKDNNINSYTNISNEVEEMVLNDINQYISEYGTVLNNFNNDEIDYQKKVKNAEEYKMNQENTLNTIKRIRDDIAKIVKESTRDDIDIVISQYQSDLMMDEQAISDYKSQLYDYYSIRIRDGMNYSDDDQLLLDNISLEELDNMTQDEFIDKVCECLPDEREKFNSVVDSYYAKYENRFDDILSALNQNDYNFSNMDELIQYFDMLSQYEEVTEFQLKNVENLIKILPYQELMNSDEFKNWENSDRNIDGLMLMLATPSGHGVESVNYNDYINKTGNNISPVDFVKLVHDELDSRLYPFIQMDSANGQLLSNLIE